MRQAGQSDPDTMPRGLACSLGPSADVRVPDLRERQGANRRRNVALDRALHTLSAVLPRYQPAPGGKRVATYGRRSSQVAPRERADRATPGRQDATRELCRGRRRKPEANAVIPAVTRRPGVT